MHAVNQLCQRSPKLLFIDLPVSQRRIVIVSFSKPAIVHHNHINSQCSGLFRQIYNRIPGKIKVSGFPAIDQNRSLHMGIFTSAYMIANAVVILLRQLG